MRRRLWMLDLGLLGLIIGTGAALRDRWVQESAREQALLRASVPAAPAPGIPPIPGVTPTAPANYLEVAQQFVFSKDRNPTVILDPPPAPPPPKPMPPLPVAYGVMNFGSGPRVVLAEKPGAEQKSYGPGQKIGEFTVVSVGTNELVFGWEDKFVRKRIEEIADRSTPVQTTPDTTQQTASAPAAPTQLANIKAGPGVELSATSKACVPGDQTPAGTVQDGYRKVVNKTPFGDSCRWEAVK